MGVQEKVKEKVKEKEKEEEREKKRACVLRARAGWKGQGAEKKVWEDACEQVREGCRRHRTEWHTSY